MVIGMRPLGLRRPVDTGEAGVVTVCQYRAYWFRGIGEGVPGILEFKDEDEAYEQ
jgi:hypothetical protein